MPSTFADRGVHCSLHNEHFDKFLLTAEQVAAIEACQSTFDIKVKTDDFKVLLPVPPTNFGTIVKWTKLPNFEILKVLIGSKKNDIATGVVGYVAILLEEESMAEISRALEVFCDLEMQFET